MAVVTWPLSSGEARGRVGGLIYNTWRGRSYVKAHAHYQTGLSPLQQTNQALAAIATAAWQSFTDQRRSAWADFANRHNTPDWTGNTRRLTGYN